MRQDFEAHDIAVHVLDDTASDFLPTLEASLLEQKVGVVLANTIMRCNVVALCARMGIPSVWVIHESWPQDQVCEEPTFPVLFGNQPSVYQAPFGCCGKT